MENILALIVPVLIAIFVIKLLLSQVKLIWKIAVNSLSGFICLWLLNLASGLTGIVFEINFITALVVGFLGIPGILLLLVFQFLR
jgi:inhibitor of the pro-sigma K processing machinery